MNHETSRIVWLIGMLISVLIIIVGVGLDITAITVFGIVVLGISYIQAFIFLRCPYCSHSFMTIAGLGGIKFIVEMPKYCPKCGKEVN